MNTTTIPISKWIAEGKASGARTMLIVRDGYPMPEPEFYPLFIARGESIAARVAEYDGVNMQRVSAVHLLNH